MTVEFAWAKSPRLRVAAIAWTGPWNEERIRSQFERVERWAKARRVRTGRWVFREPGERRWEVAIELKGRARGSEGVRTKTLPAATVARVVFDPELVSPRLVYHGLRDWLRWKRKEKEIRSVVSTREIYSGNPWTDRKAWSRTEVQFVVRK
jgi:effector-binding domain-containing protein